MVLEKENYYRIMDLINPNNDFYPLMISTINKDIDGTIYTDVNLNWALITNRLNWIYLAGFVNDTENLIIEINKLFEQNKSKEYLWWGLDDKTKKIISKYFSVNLKSFPRYKWRFDKNVFSHIPAIKNNYEINGINKDNINNISINKYYPINNFWDDSGIFLKKGFGFFIHEDNKVISVIYTASSCNNEAEIDILTDEKYRNKGLGKILIQRFIEECLLRNMVPKWDCSVSNEGSISLAKKFGFQIEKEYPVKQIIFGD